MILSTAHSHLHCDVISVMGLSLSPKVYFKIISICPSKIQDDRHIGNLFLPKKKKNSMTFLSMLPSL